MSDWQRDVGRLRLALTRFAVVAYYRPMGRLWARLAEVVAKARCG